MFFQWPEEPFLQTWQWLEESQIMLCHICDYIYYGHLESLEYLGGAQTPVRHKGKLLNTYWKKSELLTSINRSQSGIQLLTAVNNISFSNGTLQFLPATWHPLAVETLLLRSCTF